MARYQRQQAIGSVGNPYAGFADAAASQSRATMQLADTLQAFGDFGMERYQRGRIESAQEEAQAVEPGIEAPEQRTSQTMTGRAYNEIVMAGHAAAIKNDYTRRIKELEVEHPDDPVSFENKLKAYGKELLNGVDPSIRNTVALDMDQASVAPMLRAKQRNEERNINESVAGIVEAADIIADDLATAARDGNLQSVEHNQAAIDEIVNTLEEMGRYDTARKYREQIGDRVDKQIALGQAEIAIERGNGAAYIQSFIDNPPEDLAPEQVDSIAATMVTMNNRYISLQKQQQAAVSIETSREISNLKIAAKNGLGDAETLMDQTERMFNQGLLSESERTSIMNNIISADKAAGDKADTFTDIALKISDSKYDYLTIDPKDQDAYYEEIVMPQLEGLSPGEVELSQAAFVNSMKRVPKGMKQMLQNHIMSGNIDLMTQALSTVDRIDEIPGLVDSVFTPQQAAFVSRAVELSQTMDPREAIDLATKVTDPANKARVDARKIELKDLTEGYTGLDYTEQVEDIMDPFGPGGVDLDLMHKDQMSREYKAVFEASFLAGASEDQAKKEAEKKVRRDWAEWEGQAIKYSPANYYSVSGDSSYVKDQLYKDVLKNYTHADAPKKKEIFLISTEETARTASTGKPGYSIGIKRNGGLEILPGTFYPDMQKQIDKVKAENKSMVDQATESVERELPELGTL